MITETYSHIRGFNFQPPWGATGREVWLRFDEHEYRRILECAKAAFPKLNTIRVWLSFDAWYTSPTAALANMKKAGEIIGSLGLRCIPVYCNGWHSIPDFGSFCDENLRAMEHQDFEPYRGYVRAACRAMTESGSVLLHDLSNEPLNNFPDEAGRSRLHAFLAAMAEEVRAESRLPITVGSQGYDRERGGLETDFGYLDDIVDVFTLHPYAVWSAPLEGHKAHMQWLLDETKAFEKPVIVTECCWGADDDAARGKIVDTELDSYTAVGLGFVIHALTPSPVADLHREMVPGIGLYMPCMELSGAIRPYHECINQY